MIKNAISTKRPARLGAAAALLAGGLLLGAPAGIALAAPSSSGESGTHTSADTAPNRAATRSDRHAPTTSQGGDSADDPTGQSPAARKPRHRSTDDTDGDSAKSRKSTRNTTTAIADPAAEADVPSRPAVTVTSVTDDAPAPPVSVPAKSAAETTVTAIVREHRWTRLGAVAPQRPAPDQPAATFLANLWLGVRDLQRDRRHANPTAGPAAENPTMRSMAAVPVSSNTPGYLGLVGPMITGYDTRISFTNGTWMDLRMFKTGGLVVGASPASSRLQSVGVSYQLQSFQSGTWQTIYTAPLQSGTVYGTGRLSFGPYTFSSPPQYRAQAAYRTIYVVAWVDATTNQQLATAVIVPSLLSDTACSTKFMKCTRYYDGIVM